MKKINCHCLLLSLLTYCFIALLLPSSALAAKFTLNPTDFETRTGQVFQVQVDLNTEGKKTSGIDLVFEYPKDIIWVDKIQWGDIFEEEFININVKGKLSLSAAKKENSQYFQGNARLVTLTLSTHRQGTASLDFVCQDGKTDETNIIEEETASDLADCSQLRKGIYVVHGKQWGQDEQEGCQGETPSAPTNVAANSGPENGQVTLTWDKVEEAVFYTVSYGLISGNYIYGAPNIGNAKSYVVHQLTPGKNYYFAATAVGKCGSSGYSNEVWAQAGGTLAALPTKQPEVIEYIPDEESAASPSATPKPADTPQPSVFTGVAPPKKTKLPFWLKYLAAAFGIGLFLIVVVQELAQAVKKRKKPPKPPVIDEREPQETPAVQTEKEPPEPPTEIMDRPPPPFIKQRSGSNSNGTNKTPWNSSG